MALATQEVEIRKTVVQGQPKVFNTPTSTEKLGVPVCSYHSGYMRSLSRRTVIQASPDKNNKQKNPQNPIRKTTKAKKAEEGAQVVQCQLGTSGSHL
jgi:hypothetical protein